MTGEEEPETASLSADERSKSDEGLQNADNEGTKDSDATDESSKKVDDRAPQVPNQAIDPSPEDILLGRGKPIQNHPGNQHMLRLVYHYQNDYDAAHRADKCKIVEDIIGTLKSAGGRFMEHVDSGKKDDSGNRTDSHWVEVDHTTAYKKVSHAFRSHRKSSLQPHEKKTKSTDRSSTSNQRYQENSSPYPYGVMPPMMGMPNPYFGGGMLPFQGMTGMGGLPYGGFFPDGSPMNPASVQAQPALWAHQQAIAGMSPEKKPSSIATGAKENVTAKNDDATNVCAV